MNVSGSVFFHAVVPLFGIDVDVDVPSGKSITSQETQRALSTSVQGAELLSHGLYYEEACSFDKHVPSMLEYVK